MCGSNKLQLPLHPLVALASDFHAGSQLMEMLHARLPTRPQRRSLGQWALSRLLWLRQRSVHVTMMVSLPVLPVAAGPLRVKTSSPFCRLSCRLGDSCESSSGWQRLLRLAASLTSGE